MSLDSFCTPSNCKVRRLLYFNEVEHWRLIDGLSYEDIVKKCRERDINTAPSAPTIYNHFTSHYPPTQADQARMSPETMATVLDKNIRDCSEAIERVKEEGDFRVMAQLMDTQKRLLEMKLQNMQIFLQREKTVPEQLDNLRQALKDENIPEWVLDKILKALEKDMYGKIQ